MALLGLPKIIILLIVILSYVMNDMISEIQNFSVQFHCRIHF
jgi:hypothetical protein